MRRGGEERGGGGRGRKGEDEHLERLERQVGRVPLSVRKGNRRVRLLWNVSPGVP